MKENILVLGAGAWGTAIANLLAENTNENVLIWGYEKKVVNEINNLSTNNTFLPKVKLNKKLIATNSYTGKKANTIFIVVPSQYVSDIIKKYVASFPVKDNLSLSLVICSKGFDLKRKKLLSQVLEAYCPLSKMAILSGPSFAKLVANKKPTALTLASNNKYLAKKISLLLHNNYFRVYINNDIISVQINGALKNVLAIAAGITEGLGYGENARAAIISRGLVEIEKISFALGGKKGSVLGLSGIGDILLTCTSTSSRNFSFGKEVGEGKNIKDILKNKNTVTEGIENAKAAYLIKKQHNLDTPIIDAVYKVIVRKSSIKKIVNDLLSRPLKNE